MSAIRIVASGLDRGECGSWEMLNDRRNSNWCDSKTQKNTHMSKVGGRKESI